MVRGGLITHSAALPNHYREDIRSFCSKSVSSAMELDQNVTKVLLEKGVAVRPPYMPYPESVEVIQKHSFVYEWLGKNRGLTATEIADLYINITSNQLGISLANGFSQAAKSDKVREFIVRGKGLSLKQVRIYGDYLENHSIAIPSSNGQEVLVSNDSPFSDKLLMIHFTLMNHTGVGNIGKAISDAQRSDLIVDYTRIMAEILKYSEDGMNILIENGWLEKPPTTPDYDKKDKT